MAKRIGASTVDGRKELRDEFREAAAKWPLYHLLIRDEIPSEPGARFIPAAKFDVFADALVGRRVPLPGPMVGLSREEIDYWCRRPRIFADWEWFHFDGRACIGRFMLLAEDGDDLGAARITFRQLAQQAVGHIPSCREEAIQFGNDGAWLHALYLRGGLVSDTMAGEPFEWLPNNVFTLSAAALAGAPTTSERTGSANATEQALENQASWRLLNVFANGVADERIDRASSVLQDDNLTANEKLTKIDALIPFPGTVSAEQLGQLLGVTKQAVMKTDWWTTKRKGEKASEIGRRQTVHQERRKQHEPNYPDED